MRIASRCPASKGPGHRGRDSHPTNPIRRTRNEPGGRHADSGRRQLRQFVYNLVQYLGQLDVACDVRRNDEIGLDKITGYDGVLLSPGPPGLRLRPASA